MSAFLRLTAGSQNNAGPPGLRMASRFSFLLILFLLLDMSCPSWTLKRARQTDPCTIVSNALFPSTGYSVTTPSAMLRCLRVFPYNPALGKSVVANTLKILAFYVFESIQRSSPYSNPPSRVLLRESLANISATTWPSEYDFYLAMYNLFNSLNDAHTIFESTCYFGNAQAYIAFPLISVVANGTQVIKVVPDPTSLDFDPGVRAATESALNIKLSNYGGAEVVMIEGQPALTYIRNWVVANAGQYKDINAQFNTAMTGYTYDPQTGDLLRIHGIFTSRVVLPSNDTIRMTFRRVGKQVLETMNVPWYVLFSGDYFGSASDYSSTFCMGEYSSSDLSMVAGDAGTRHPARSQRTQMGRRRVVNARPMLTFPSRRRVKNTVVRRLAASSGVKELLYEYIKLYLLADGVTAVLVLPDELNPSSEIGDSDWESQVLTAFKLMKSNSVTQLIIDLQNNPGGDISLAYGLTNYLFPAKLVRQFPGNFRAGTLAQKLVHYQDVYDSLSSLYAYSEWADLLGNIYTSPSKFFFPVLNQTIGGIIDTFATSQLDLPSTSTPLTMSTRKVGPFPASKILVLTNGNCASSGTLIAASLSQYSGVRTVAVGGLAGMPMAYSNLGGGAVYGLSDLLSEFLIGPTLTRALAQLVPQALPNQTLMAFTIHKAFSHIKPLLPLEYVFDPSTFRFNYTDDNVFNVAVVWQTAANFFKS
eukprot:TRINITY_DN3165_c0_g1_i1.p1 TRINITY_DN3165_c0_g1~~TRINITY_DN3165_c0_g1_i1.p1  ORF type:complete len:727 (+),score=106.60 TRINITY_DN3165_c0_g1_i1:77-2182(+)